MSVPECGCARLWRVDNGAFIGKALVNRESINGMGLTTKEDDWLDYAVDLRVINSLKPDSFDELDRTALYHNGDFVATVNAPFAELLPQWLKVRHVYDEPWIHQQQTA